ncbi:MAG TPA: class II glutamine amidotransferase [Longimicrobiales bacterium]|nr:class II glutamine amidotransferase [Longimicrobiales bacterium]
MCRLIAYLGAPISPAHLVFGGSHSLYEQSWAPREQLSGSVNADGYGVVWYAGGAPARIAEARPIWHDPELPRTLSAITSPCVVAALRSATPGLAVDRASVLPLVHGRWSFVLNGWVPDFRRSHMRALRSELPDELYAELEGASDSETLFLLVVAALERGASASEALAEVASRVRSRVGRAEAQLNMVLSDGERLTAIRSSTVLVTNSLYVAIRPPFAPEGVVLASEAPEPGAVWSVVDGHSWIEIDGEGRVRSEPLLD